MTCLKPSRRATAISSPVPRVLARNGSLRPATERQPARARHLDHRDPAGQHTPLRVDRIAERTGHPRDAPRSAACREQGVERALATVGERELDDVVEAGAARGRLRSRLRLRRPQRSSELVGTRDSAWRTQRID